MNFGYNRDWVAEYKCADWFKVSRPWISGVPNGTWDDGRAIDVDQKGWVRSTLANQIARTIFGGYRNLKLPDGEYTITYDGNGEGGRIVYGGHATLVSASPGRHVVRVTTQTIGTDTDGQWWMGLQNVDPTNPIINIKVAPPGLAGQLSTTTFNPAFTSRLTPWSTFRFMNTLDTNGGADALVNWQDRPHMDDARWYAIGMPLEACIQLCNEQNADFWYNIPSHASDDFVHQAAKLIRDTLNPALRCYVEYTNEVWNGGVYVATADYVRAQGLARGYGRSRVGGTVDSNLAMIQYYAQRSAEVGDIFAQEFGVNWRSRLTRVIAGQCGNSWVLQQALQFIVPGTTVPVGRRVDAAAIAPYFNWRFPGGPASQTEVNRLNMLTMDQLFAEINSTLLPSMYQGIAANRNVINAYAGLKMVAYEGGQHLITPSGATNTVPLEVMFNAMNIDPRMKTIYTAMHNEWKRQGGQLYMAFTEVDTASIGARGRFGILRWLDEPLATSPKRQALEEYVAANPKWW